MSVSASNGFLYAPFTSCGDPHIPIFDNFDNLYSDQPADVSQRRRLRDLVGGRQLGLRLTRAGLHLPGAIQPEPAAGVRRIRKPGQLHRLGRYIVGNTITGTPNGHFFGESAGSFDPVFAGITVDTTAISG